MYGIKLHTSLAGEFIGLDLFRKEQLDGIRFVIGKNGGSLW